MLFYFVEFGVPFDLANDSFWEASSASHLRGAGKDLKGLLTGFNDYEMLEFLKEKRSRSSDIFLQRASKVESEICEQFYMFIEGKCTFVEDLILKNKNKKAVKRYCYYTGLQGTIWNLTCTFKKATPELQQRGSINIASNT